MHIDTITVRWQFEDELDLDISTGMYRASDIIDGVRMYPFIITDEGKFYLEVRA